MAGVACRPGTRHLQPRGRCTKRIHLKQPSQRMATYWLGFITQIPASAVPLPSGCRLPSSPTKDWWAISFSTRGQVSAPFNGSEIVPVGTLAKRSRATSSAAVGRSRWSCRTIDRMKTDTCKDGGPVKGSAGSLPNNSTGGEGQVPAPLGAAVQSFCATVNCSRGRGSGWRPAIAGRGLEMQDP